MKELALITEGFSKLFVEEEKLTRLNSCDPLDRISWMNQLQQRQN